MGGSYLIKPGKLRRHKIDIISNIFGILIMGLDEINLWYVIILNVT